LIESGEGHGDVWLLFTVAEEIGLLGAANLDIQALGVDFGYVLDTGPPVGSLVTRTATHDLLNARIIGRPAHAGKHPEEGINAISVAADALTGMKLGRISPQTTANFGLVVGGTAVNVVCPWVELKGEARSNDPAELDEQIAHMKAKLQEAAERWGAQVEIEHDRHYVAYQLADDSPVVATARSLFQELGYSGELRTTLGGSDANMSNAHGVPTAVLGTGMDKIHTHEEFIRREDLVSLAEVTLALIRRVAGTI
ncbi:MAG: M20/M25/M40 family metallo-hydrolase, partial [Fimbriimonadaceae bacterium]|nr:M20/M25/M40 family metallo-hydrolase [Fimbriimonadaceae bacterium]